MDEIRMYYAVIVIWVPIIVGLCVAVWLTHCADKRDENKNKKG